MKIQIQDAGSVSRFILLMGLLACVAGISPAVAQENQARDVEFLMALDREFSEVSRKLGPAAAWTAFAHENIVQLNDGVQPLIGLANVLPTFNVMPEGASLTWTPEDGDISQSYDLGFTWGRWLYDAPGEDGESVQSHGKYVTIWKKQADGNWKIILDGGNSNPAPPAD